MAVGAKPISYRAYMTLMSCLVLIGFVIVAGSYALCTETGFVQNYVETESNAGLAFTIASIAAPIIGFIFAFIGKKRHTLIPSVIGYVLIVFSLGFTTGLSLVAFSLDSILGAFVGTVIVSAVFAILGFLFPTLFQKIYGVAIGVLLGAMITAGVCVLAGIPTAWYGWVVLVIFACFIAHDTRKAANDEPCVANAFYHAVNIWIDIINVFLELLNIFEDNS